MTRANCFSNRLSPDLLDTKLGAKPEVSKNDDWKRARRRSGWSQGKPKNKWREDKNHDTKTRRKTPIWKNATLKDYNFEKVDSFVYLDTTLIKDKIDEIKRRIMVISKIFYLVLPVGRACGRQKTSTEKSRDKISGSQGPTLDCSTIEEEEPGRKT